ncbi:Zinc finger C-x8-C-x5-C-x3-H type (and similar), putative [Angomonas deanei]|uniref:Zinc finger C-x8-C-x5-C-x3-H type (And similar), putative n=1 Tax=Angomonas deanei TaxID=59799 RepID=A0A7G2CGA2_9TRYP|nr:Zinc finger C-x8-C-x5-C-x3-H type (and similar), putative [Angomonas deanei]
MSRSADRTNTAPTRHYPDVDLSLRPYVTLVDAAMYLSKSSHGAISFSSALQGLPRKRIFSQEELLSLRSTDIQPQPTGVSTTVSTRVSTSQTRPTVMTGHRSSKSHSTSPDFAITRDMLGTYPSRRGEHTDDTRSPSPFPPRERSSSSSRSQGLSSDGQSWKSGSKVCHQFMTTGRCSFGSRCLYHHGSGGSPSLTGRNLSSRGSPSIVSELTLSEKRAFHEHVFFRDREVSQSPFLERTSPAEERQTQRGSAQPKRTTDVAPNPKSKYAAAVAVLPPRNPLATMKLNTIQNNFVTQKKAHVEPERYPSPPKEYAVYPPLPPPAPAYYQDPLHMRGRPVYQNTQQYPTSRFSAWAPPFIPKYEMSPFYSRYGVM